MKNPPLTKPRGTSQGKALPELTKFKELWKTLPGSSREYWLARLFSTDTQPQIRAEIYAKTGVNLLHDNQLTGICRWLKYQADADEEEARQEEDARRETEAHPDWTMEQLREEVLRLSYLRAKTTGDFKLGLATVDRDLKGKDLSLAERRLAVLEENQRNAREKLEAVIKKPEGISKETLREIAEAAKLL